jgi:hypothetical protein
MNQFATIGTAFVIVCTVAGLATTIYALMKARELLKEATKFALSAIGYIIEYRVQYTGQGQRESYINIRACEYTSSQIVISKAKSPCGESNERAKRRSKIPLLLDKGAYARFLHSFNHQTF